MVSRDRTTKSHRVFFFTANLSPFQGGNHRDNVLLSPRVGDNEGNCYLSRKRRFMALISAQQDLRDTSLKAVSGGLNRLQYLADLRDKGSNSYSHWGLSRVYGAEAASQALAQEHGQLLAKLLAAPLAGLIEDLEGCGHAVGLDPAAFLERLRARHPASLLPPNPAAGSELHLNSVLAALSALLDSPACATRLA